MGGFYFCKFFFILPSYYIWRFPFHLNKKKSHDMIHQPIFSNILLNSIYDFTKKNVHKNILEYLHSYDMNQGKSTVYSVLFINIIHLVYYLCLSIELNNVTYTIFKGISNLSIICLLQSSYDKYQTKVCIKKYYHTIQYKTHHHLVVKLKARIGSFRIFF